MKKIYLKPEIEVVKIQTLQMLATSTENLQMETTEVDDEDEIY